MPKTLAVIGLLWTVLLSGQTAAVWSARELDAAARTPEVRIHSGPGYSIDLRSIRTVWRDPEGGTADHMLWIRKGSGRVWAGQEAAAESGDVIRIPAQTPWRVEPREPLEFLDIRVAPLGPGRRAPSGIRPAPGWLGFRASKAMIADTIAATEANAPLHTQDNFTANFVLFKGRTGPWEAHAGCTDIYWVQTGAGVIETGGTIAGARDVSPGEPRGTAILGATRHGVAEGTLLVIPRGAAHHMNPEKLPLAYVLIKVWSD